MGLTGYVTVVLSVALIITISQSILPEGRCKNAAKIIFRFILIIAVINPILQADFNIDISLKQNDVIVDEKVISYLEEEKISIIENKCAEILKKDGIFVKEIKISAYIRSANYFIEKVTVILDKKRITNESEHINITSKAKSLLSDLLKIDKEVIAVESG